MPTINVSSKSVLDPRGELLSISVTTMTYPNLVKDLNCHGKESAPPLPETEACINEHGSYFLTILTIPCSYDFFSKLICIYAITHKSYNPFLLPVHKILEKVIVDVFVYHKFCKFHGVVA